MKAKLEELYELYLAGDDAIARIGEIEKRPLMGIEIIRNYAEVFTTCLQQVREIEAQLPKDFGALIHSNGTLISVSRANGGIVSFQNMAKNVTIKS